MKKKILILGGTRYLGKLVVKQLLKQDYEIILANRGITKDDFNNKVTRIKFDRYNEQSIIDNLGNIEYDVIIDFIAFSSYDVEILLNNVKTKRYIVTSSKAVYENLNSEVKEDNFNPYQYEYQSITNDQVTYAQGKRLVEASLVLNYPNLNYVIVRIPFIIGSDDYTKRLDTYLESYQNQTELYINNIYSDLAFITQEDATAFHIFMIDNKYTGIINAASNETISLYNIFKYFNDSNLDDKIIKLYSNENSVSAPYNNWLSHKLNTDLAVSLGFELSNTKNYIDELVNSFNVK